MIDRTELIEAEAWEDDVIAALLELTGTEHLLSRVHTAFKAARILSTFPADGLANSISDAVNRGSAMVLSAAGINLILETVTKTMIREDDK